MACTSPDPYWDPRSEWQIRPGLGGPWAQARPNAPAAAPRAVLDAATLAGCVGSRTNAGRPQKSPGSPPAGQAPPAPGRWDGGASTRSTPVASPAKPGSAPPPKKQARGPP